MSLTTPLFVGLVITLCRIPSTVTVSNSSPHTVPSIRRALGLLVSHCVLGFGVYYGCHGYIGASMTSRSNKMMQLLEQLRTQVHSRKYKNIDILSLSQEVTKNETCIYNYVHSCSCLAVSSDGLWACHKLQECQGPHCHVSHSRRGPHLITGNANGVLIFPASSGRHEKVCII